MVVLVVPVLVSALAISAKTLGARLTSLAVVVALTSTAMTLLAPLAATFSLYAIGSIASLVASLASAGIDVIISLGIATETAQTTVAAAISSRPSVESLAPIRTSLSLANRRLPSPSGPIPRPSTGGPGTCRLVISSLARQSWTPTRPSRPLACPAHSIGKREASRPPKSGPTCGTTRWPLVLQVS